MNDATKNAVKAGFFAALWAFIALFGLSLVGWLDDVVGVASNDTAAFGYGDPAVLVKAAVSAAAASLAGLVGLVVRLAQTVTGRGDVPKYINKP